MHTVAAQNFMERTHQSIPIFVSTGVDYLLPIVSIPTLVYSKSHVGACDLVVEVHPRISRSKY